MDQVYRVSRNHLSPSSPPLLLGEEDEVKDEDEGMREYAYWENELMWLYRKYNDNLGSSV